MHVAQGNFLWSLFDYGGESTWPAVVSFYGVLDLAGFAKPSYFWYRAWWGLEAGHEDAASRTFFFPEWTLPAATVGKDVRVVVYAAGAAVRAILNGTPLGAGPTTMPPLGYVSLTIPYTPGNLTVVSLDAGGAQVGAYTSITAGAPASLTAVVDWPGAGPGGALLSDGEDAALVAVTVLDAAGVVVPDARVNVSFSADGPGFVLGVGNGDQLSHLPRQGITFQPTYGGLARAVLRANSGDGVSGTITLRVSAEGLTGAEVLVAVVPPAATAEHRAALHGMEE